MSPTTWVLLAILMVLGLQFREVFNRAINWDEFWHFNHICQFAAGTLSRTLQSLHARLYVWVLDLPGTSIDHIIAIRTIMFGYELVTATAIVAMATRFSDRLTGLLCALAYLSFPFVFEHGASFRYDPPAAALMMSSLWLLLCRPLDLKSIALGSLLIGLAPLVSIKTVLYAPAFLGVVWLRWNEHGRSPAYITRLVALAIASCAMFALLYWWHGSGIAAGEAQDANFVKASGSRMFAIEAKPYWGVTLHAALIAPLQAVIVLLTPAALFSTSIARDEKIALAGLFLPVTTLLFYHNTAPYFYVFMLPPVLVAGSITLGRLRARFSLAFICAVLFVDVGISLATKGDNLLDTQRELQRVASEVFPRGTRYFDFAGFLPDFQKANPFLTTVVTRDYHDRGIPVMRNAMLEAPVPLVMENNDVLALVLKTHDHVPQWLPEDVRALRSTYIPFWGPFWIAGREVPAGRAPVSFEVLVPGPYTITGSALTIDGRAHAPGEVVRLARGSYTIRGERAAAARLIWGNRLRAPREAPPPPPYFMSF